MRKPRGSERVAPLIARWHEELPFGRCEHYRAPYEDPDGYQAYRVLSRDGRRTEYYAYCPRENIDAELLRMRGEVVDGPFGCMLRLRYRDEAVPPEAAEVVEFIQDGWIVAESRESDMVERSSRHKGATAL